MAMEKFWGSVRTAMELFEPPYPNVPRTTAWLNRRAIDGFDPRDFEFLPDDEREQLEASVATFRQATAKLSPKEPPTAAQLEQGAEAIEGILRILDPNRNYSPEFFRIKKILDAELDGKLPPQVETLGYEPTIDSEGDPALRVLVRLSDESAREGWLKEKQVGEIRDTIEAAYRWTGSTRFLFVNFQNTKLATAKVGQP